jgi:hypothetical protein
MKLPFIPSSIQLCIQIATIRALESSSVESAQDRILSQDSVSGKPGTVQYDCFAFTYSISLISMNPSFMSSLSFLSLGDAIQS